MWQMPEHWCSAADVMLTHAVSRIMLNGSIDNIQMSWVKEGPKMAQILLSWGANDFGGTSSTRVSQHQQVSARSAFTVVIRSPYGRLGKRLQNETPHMMIYAHLMKIGLILMMQFTIVWIIQKMIQRILAIRIGQF